MDIKSLPGNQVHSPERDHQASRPHSGWQKHLVAGCSRRAFSEPIKLGPKTTAWRVVDIRSLIERLGR